MLALFLSVFGRFSILQLGASVGLERKIGY